MRKIIPVATSLVALLAFARPAFAVTISNFDTCGIPFLDLGKLMSNILAIMFFFAALLAFLFIIIGGIQWIAAGGDKVAAASARDRITASVVGLLIVVAAFAISVILNAVLGINLFGFSFPEAMQTAGAGTLGGGSEIPQCAP